MFGIIRIESIIIMRFCLLFVDYEVCFESGRTSETKQSNQQALLPTLHIYDIFTKQLIHIPISYQFSHWRLTHDTSQTQ